MSSETLDAARRAYQREVRLGRPLLSTVEALVREERADAERVQRERADANAAKCLRYREQIEELENAFGCQRERADGLERKLAGVREIVTQHKTAFAEALRGDMRLMNLLAADIEAARKEDGRE